LLEVHVLGDQHPGDAAIDMHVWIGGLDLKLRIESGETLSPCLDSRPSRTLTAIQFSAR
jgi:hypothetical protein